MKDIATLIAVFAYLSVLTFGGGMAAFPELKLLTVEIHQWLTFPQLIHFYSVGQAAPGPNMMMIVAVGEKVAGPLGAFAAISAYLLPTGLITFSAGRIWAKLSGWPWRESIQRGLAPVSIGLILAGSISLAKGAFAGPLTHPPYTGALTILIAIGVFFAILLTRINPVFFIGGAALIGWLALGERP